MTLSTELKERMQSYPGPSDSEVDAAKSVIRRDYYASVLSCAQNFAERLEKGEWDDEESAREALDEELDGGSTHWGIYTYAAYQAVYASDLSAEAYEQVEDMGIDLAKESHGGISIVGGLCFKLDVEAELGDAITEHFEEKDEEEEEAS